MATTVFNNNDDNTGDGCAGALCGLQVDKVPTVVAAITHHHKAEGKQLHRDRLMEDKK